MKPLNDLEKGWLAAAIDGEGTLQGKLGLTLIQVVNTNEAFIKYAASLLGPLARIYIYDDVDGTRLRKYTVRLHIQADIKEILVQIEPYLIIKRELARKIIIWCDGRFKRKARAHDKNGNAKLTVEIVRQLRLDYSSGKYTQTKIAKTLGVSTALISRICKHKTWRSEMNSSKVELVLRYQQKFCHPKMTVEQQTKVIVTGMAYCHEVGGVTLNQLSDQTVKHVLELSEWVVKEAPPSQLESQIISNEPPAAVVTLADKLAALKRQKEELSVK
jgi:hypothetical protein